MNILLTGGNGVIGSNIKMLKSNEFNILSPSSKELNLLNRNVVDEFFSINEYDVIIHCAIKGAVTQQNYGIKQVYQNLFMIQNILKNKHRFGVFINLDSGATLKEDGFPSDFYGISKKTILQKIGLNLKKFINIRLFSTFCYPEAKQRFISSSIRNLMSGEPIVIHQDKYYDFLYVKDLVYVIHKILLMIKTNISNVEFGNTYDAVYNREKLLLSDMAKLIMNVVGLQSSIKILDGSVGKPYIGKGNNLFSQTEYGLQKGIYEVFKIMERQKK